MCLLTECCAGHRFCVPAASPNTLKCNLCTAVPVCLSLTTPQSARAAESRLSGTSPPPPPTHSAMGFMLAGTCARIMGSNAGQTSPSSASRTAMTAPSRKPWG